MIVEFKIVHLAFRFTPLVFAIGTRQAQIFELINRILVRLIELLAPDNICKSLNDGERHKIKIVWSENSYFLLMCVNIEKAQDLTRFLTNLLFPAGPLFY